MPEYGPKPIAGLEGVFRNQRYLRPSIPHYHCGEMQRAESRPYKTVPSAAIGGKNGTSLLLKRRGAVGQLRRLNYREARAAGKGFGAEHGILSENVCDASLLGARHLSIFPQRD